MATYAVTGIGNAIMDYLGFVDDAFLQQHAITKGGMQLLDAAPMAALLQALPDPRVISGGSVANTMAALASLGLPCGYLGRVAEDVQGKAFAQDMDKTGIAFPHNPAKDGKPTASCAVCITPDGERSMSTYIGACAELTRDDLDDHMLRNTDILYVEGYLWDADAAKDAITHSISIAKDAGARIALTLSDSFCVERHRESFIALISGHVDIVFANEDEACALFESNIDVAQKRLGMMSDISIITRSAEPALVTDNGMVTKVPAIATTLVDSTGAGDAFAAGFLYGISKQATPTDAASYGHKLASHIISSQGARSVEALPVM